MERQTEQKKAANVVDVPNWKIYLIFWVNLINLLC